MPLFPNLPLLLFTEEDAELLLHYQAYVVATAHGDIQSHTHRSSLTLLFFSSSSSSFASRPRATIQAWDKLQGSFVRSFVRSLQNQAIKVSNCKEDVLNKFVKNCHNCLQYERVIKIFYFRIFDITNIWLNIFVDNPHLTNITKLTKKKKKS
jgi:hypothetical protein